MQKRTPLQRTSHQHHLASSAAPLRNSLGWFSRLFPINTWLNVTMPRDLFFKVPSFPLCGCPQWGWGGIYIIYHFSQTCFNKWTPRTKGAIGVTMSCDPFSSAAPWSMHYLLPQFSERWDWGTASSVTTLNKATEPENGSLGSLALEPALAVLRSLRCGHGTPAAAQTLREALGTIPPFRPQLLRVQEKRCPPM